jgi:hypothetical protein
LGIFLAAGNNVNGRNVGSTFGKDDELHFPNNGWVGYWLMFNHV